MLGLDINNLVVNLHNWPPVCVGILIFVICLLSIIVLLYAFGKSGLYVYTATALIVGNIQVVKVIKVSFLPDPVAMGTIVYCSIFLCTNILSEYYGPSKAKRAIWLGFFAYACMTLLMLATLGMRPLGQDYANSSQWAWAMPMQEHLAAVFAPAPAVLIAGMCAFIISQLNDVWIYQNIRKWSKGKWLWLRNAAAFAISSALDTIIFSVLAWRILIDQPVPWEAVLHTYILGTYIIRLAIGSFNIPVMYCMHAYLRKR